jgi:beta-lactamase regulating signal transducer with metallopeptidase domain
VIAASPPVAGTPEQRSGTGTVVAMSLLLGAWLVGILRVGYRIGSGYQEAARLRRGIEVDANELIFGGAELARRVGLRRIPPLQFVEDAPGPLLVGLVRPTILLPTTLLSQPDPTRLRMVLAHEMAHVARRDLLWSWLPTVGSALFFFHPLVRLACHEWQLAHELACDEQAIRVTGTEPSVYGETLVRVTAQSRVGALGQPAVIGASSPHLLTKRLLEMNSLRAVTAGKLRAGVVVASVLGLVAIPTWRVVAQANAPDTPPVELLKRVRAHYQRLDSFSMRLRHQDSSGLYPGKFSQSLEWKKGGRFVLKVLEQGAKLVPDDYADGKQVVTIFPDGRRETTKGVQPEPNFSPGWEVTGGVIMSFLQNTQTGEFLFSPPPGRSFKWSIGSKTEWQGKPVRELVAEITSENRTTRGSLFVDKATEALLGFEAVSGGKLYQAIYDQQLENPSLPATLGDAP